jgi:Tfp pilus assembly protein PilF
MPGRHPAPLLGALRLFAWPILVLLLAGMTTGAQVNNSNQYGQSPGSPPATSTTPPGASGAPTTPSTITPDVTVTAPRPEQPLPKLPPDQFADCMGQFGFGFGGRASGAVSGGDLPYLAACEAGLNRDKHIVIESCLNPSGSTAASRVIQACTESLDRKIFQGDARFFLFVNRAEAYFSLGDKQHALDDYNEAVKLAPRNTDLYYNRGVFYAAQNDGDAALRDFDTALSINPKLVPALRQRAKIYQARGNFGGAVADYSEAIRLQPKTAALWSERGYVSLRQHDYESAMKDEAQAVQLDPKLARAYFLRGAAFGGLGDRGNALSDLVTAVRLDPSLDRYVRSKGKTALLTLPPAQ